MRISGLAFVGFSLFLAAQPREARAWGSYGHEQINDAAVSLLTRHASSAVAQCFAKNRDVLDRLAITPDLDWKMYGSMQGLTPEERRKKAYADRFEHPLHFFEADAFVADPMKDRRAIPKLPSGPYDQGFEKYRELLAANAEKVAQIDPSKVLDDPEHPTVRDVTQHGSAPWRIVQLYQKGVEALRAKDFSAAALYLGTMGHYVGDMSQPFHATLNYDGKAWPSPAEGIHHTFEEGILEDAAKSVGADHDVETGLWSTFRATENPVLAMATKIFNRSAERRLRAPEIVSVSLSLLNAGYPLINPLLEAFSRECARMQKREGERSERPYCRTSNPEPGQRPAAPRVGVEIERAFAAAHIEDLAHGIPDVDVLTAAENQMASSVAFLARLWLSALEEASASDAVVESSCPRLSFKEMHVILKYPLPTYLNGLKNL